MSITWGEQYKINISEMDNQHKKLVDMVNELDAAMRVGQATKLVEKILDGVLSYANTHFVAEEKLINTRSYPDYSQHKQEHDSFTTKAVTIYKQFKEGRRMLSIDIMNFLSSWLTNHILINDKKYGLFLNSKGVV